MYNAPIVDVQAVDRHRVYQRYWLELGGKLCNEVTVIVVYHERWDSESVVLPRGNAE